MIREIKITKASKTIPKDFNLTIDKLTVITGENNTGKTNFIKATEKAAKFFDENGTEVEPKIVYIGAENIRPTDNETKFTAKTSNLIENLANLFSNLEIKFELEKAEEIIEHIREVIVKTNKNIEEFAGHNRHALSVDINENNLESKIILQALIENIIGSEDGQERKLEDLGQGTQRIIVASILKAYVDILIEKNIQPEKPTVIIFEEPEIYLHPKLKRTLNATLKNIAMRDNHQVIITTHDPYFAYTNLKESGCIIYSFFRNDSDVTDKKEPDEIFGIEDELLHIHLFNKVLQKLKVDGINITPMDESSALNKHLITYSNGELRDNIFPGGAIHRLSLPLHIRHVIHHPGGGNSFDGDDLAKSIKILNKILAE